MSRRISNSGNVIVVALVPEVPRICSMCEQLEECRPYGHNGADVCFSCSETIQEIVNHNITIILFGESGQLK